MWRRARGLWETTSGSQCSCSQWPGRCMARRSQTARRAVPLQSAAAVRPASAHHWLTLTAARPPRRAAAAPRGRPRAWRRPARGCSTGGPPTARRRTTRPCPRRGTGRRRPATQTARSARRTPSARRAPPRTAPARPACPPAAAARCSHSPCPRTGRWSASAGAPPPRHTATAAPTASAARPSTRSGSRRCYCRTRAC